MPRLEELSEVQRKSALMFPCMEHDDAPNTPLSKSLSQAKLALVTSAGLHLRSDRPFTLGSSSAVNIPGDYRVIPGDTEANDLVMSHISTGYDRSGFQKDWNVVFPLDRIRELAGQGVIGSVADFHYSFMGATAPQQMETAARTLAGLLKKDSVTAVLLTPV